MIQPLMDFKKLPLHERLQLVEDLWDSIAIEEDRLDLPQWQKDELDTRAAEFAKHPESGVPWEQAKAIIRGHK